MGDRKRTGVPCNNMHQIPDRLRSPAFLEQRRERRMQSIQRLKQQRLDSLQLGWRMPETRGELRGALARMMLDLPKRARRVVVALSDPALAGRPAAEIAARARVSIPGLNRWRRDPAVLVAVEAMLEPAWRGERPRLATAIVEDAMTRLEDVSDKKALALVQTREQAAALMGLNVKPVQRQAVAAKVDHLHRFEGQDPAALEAFAVTGVWDEAMYGPSPLRRKS